MENEAQWPMRNLFGNSDKNLFVKLLKRLTFDKKRWTRRQRWRRLLCAITLFCFFSLKRQNNNNKLRQQNFTRWHFKWNEFENGFGPYFVCVCFSLSQVWRRAMMWKAVMFQHEKVFVDFFDRKLNALTATNEVLVLNFQEIFKSFCLLYMSNRIQSKCLTFRYLWWIVPTFKYMYCKQPPQEFEHLKRTEGNNNKHTHTHRKRNKNKQEKKHWHIIEKIKKLQ